MLKEINNSNCNNIELDAIYGNLRVNSGLHRGFNHSVDGDLLRLNHPR